MEHEQHENGRYRKRKGPKHFLQYNYVETAPSRAGAGAFAVGRCNILLLSCGYGIADMVLQIWHNCKRIDLHNMLFGQPESALRSFGRAQNISLLKNGPRLFLTGGGGGPP